MRLDPIPANTGQRQQSRQEGSRTTRKEPTQKWGEHAAPLHCTTVLPFFFISIFWIIHHITYYAFTNPALRNGCCWGSGWDGGIITQHPETWLHEMSLISS